MRGKRLGFWALLAAGLCLLTACAPQAINPLVKNEATAVPGLAMNLHAASASDQNVEETTVTLYFRYLDEPMLAPESRTLAVRRDESLEYAIVQALIDGPSAGHSDLRALLPPGAGLESVASRGDMLFVTFGAGFLEDGVPDTWKSDAVWAEEAPILRRLTAQSIAASLTESKPYTGVQILIHKTDSVQTSLRLENAYFLDGSTGLSEPIARDETLLLTPQRTAETLLTAWQQHDAQRLYRYVAEAGKPSLATFTEAFSDAPTLLDFSVSGGSVTEDGQRATLLARLQTLYEGQSAARTDYPLLLARENGIWKMEYERLTALLAR